MRDNKVPGVVRFLRLVVWRTPVRSAFHPVWWGCLAALALGSAACGPGPVDGRATGEAKEALTGGVLATNNGAPFGSAVKLDVCSATKIGPRMFLTAGHCSHVIHPQRAANGGTQLTIDNSLAGNSPTVVGLDRFYMHPGYRGPYTDTVDAAVIFTSQDISSIPAMPVDTGSVNDGTNLPIIGYGCDIQNPADQGQKQWSNFTVLSAAQAVAMLPPGQDHAAKTAQSYYYDGGPIDGSYRQLCTSDSGGPAVQSWNDQFGTHWKVTGISTQQFLDSTTMHRKMSVSLRTGPISAWIITPTLAATRGTVTNILTGMCLSGGGQTTSGPVTLDVCDSTTTSTGTQYWSVFNSTDMNGVVKQQLQNGLSGLCLHGAASDATSLTMAPCSTTSTERFTLTASATTPTEIAHELTGQYVGALYTNNAYGADLYMRESANRQLWLIVP